MDDRELHDVLDAAIADAMDRHNVPIAPGVEGIEHDFGAVFEVASIRAVTEGSGAVGAYLDRLPRHRTVIVPFVTSDRLRGMLERRGFTTPDLYEHPLMGLIGGGQIMVREPLLSFGD